MRSPPPLLALALLLASGCSRGFGVDLDLDRGCLVDATSLVVEVEQRPGGSRRRVEVTDAAAFFAGGHRVVIIPSDGTTAIVVTVTARGPQGTAQVSETIPVEGHQLVRHQLRLVGCGGADLGPAVDRRIDDLPLDGGEALLDGPPAGDVGPRCTETSCRPPTPVCDLPGGRCVACLLDDHCPLGQLCRGQQCLPGCSLQRGCGDGGSCELDAGACRACRAKADCGGPTPLCDPSNGVCVPCLVDGDCPDNGACRRVAGLLRCEPRCRVDQDCPRPDGGAAVACCSGVCAALDRHVDNCGACGIACQAPSAVAACQGGRCVIASCQGLFADCDRQYANGCETNTANDSGNCLGCGKKCTANAGVAACNLGCYVSGCNAPFADCDHQYANGCETNTGNDPLSCKGCGNQCPKPANANPACIQGACAVGSCNAGFADCNQSAGDGCEVGLNTDTANCGKCGQQCGSIDHGLPGCRNGTCGIAGCDPGFKDCNSTPTDGCEANTARDPKNCGDCGRACPVPPNGAPTCTNGVCGEAMCGGQFQDCNGSNQDGCETDTQNDVKHCGACNRPCPPRANASSSCVKGQCGFDCNVPFKDCNGAPNDGCEIDVSDDVAHCGVCGKACPPVANGVPGCAVGQCAIKSCNAPFQSCDQQVANGCETNTSADVRNCRGCGNACPAVANGAPKCEASECRIGSCTAPFLDCDGNYGSGCETNTATDVKNCGACNRPCLLANATPRCSQGACAIAGCNAPFLDCDAQPGNGCEVDPRSNRSHCGGCNRPCAGTCLNGICLNSGGDMARPPDMGAPQDFAMPRDFATADAPGADLAGCLNGGQRPPGPCYESKDPYMGSAYVVCKADCSQALLSHLTGTTTFIYHPDYICKQLGYAQAKVLGDNCGNECGACPAQDPATSCKTPGMGTYRLPKLCADPNDMYGPAYCTTLSWNCFK